jgi:hypothetical protein
MVVLGGDSYSIAGLGGLGESVQNCACSCKGGIHVFERTKPISDLFALFSKMAKPISGAGEGRDEVLKLRHKMPVWKVNLR